jgi:hypothetical protein
MAAVNRVRERRKAAALARHYRDQEGLSIAEIARKLGWAKSTVKAYLYDPTGEKARTVKRGYRGVCRGCGAYTQPRTMPRSAASATTSTRSHSVSDPSFAPVQPDEEHDQHPEHNLLGGDAGAVTDQKRSYER